jgi:SAM-dependent methyltransferase
MTAQASRSAETGREKSFENNVGEQVRPSNRERLMPRTVIDWLNQRAFSSGAAKKFYDRASTLLEAESVILDELAPEIKNRKLLDIGIGGGRTTPFLLKISPDYTGIDYSPVLVERAKSRLHLESLYVCDVRDMSRFADCAFDFALFSFNGLDHISHQDRLQALREIHRVLRPDGIFAFSSHNREWKNAGKPPWRFHDKSWTLPFLKSCFWALVFQPRHWRLRRFEVFENDYAIMNDGGLYYSVFSYYCSIRSQMAQLQELAFHGTRAYDIHGRVVNEDRDSPWLYYVARKASGPNAGGGTSG